MTAPVNAPKSELTTSELSHLLAHVVIESGAARAATAGVAWRKDGQWVSALGAAGWIDQRPACVETPFDLASVTKPALAVLCATLVAEGTLSWDAPIAKYLPELADTPGGQESFASHLSHRAGLRAHIELFAELSARAPFDRKRALRRAASAKRPEGAYPAALYSDLGYILVGEALSRAWARPLDALLKEKLASLTTAELGSSRQWLAQDPHFAARVAPTEVVPWRGGQLRGMVHDDNAWALTGHAISGHAGLFGTADAVLRLGVSVVDALSGRGPLSPTVARELVRERPGGSLRMGFDSKSGPESMAGRVAGPNTFGHLGFTGTSLWCDPDCQTVTVLLTNRVNPTQRNRTIRAARPAVHDALFQFAKAHSTPLTESTEATVE